MTFNHLYYVEFFIQINVKDLNYVYDTECMLVSLVLHCLTPLLATEVRVLLTATFQQYKLLRVWGCVCACETDKRRRWPGGETQLFFSSASCYIQPPGITKRGLNHRWEIQEILKSPAWCQQAYSDH